MRRGTALISVLLASSLLLVVCMSVGSLAMLDLNLAGSYSWKVQSQLMADAAVNQVITELEREQQAAPDGATGSVPRMDLVGRFQRPVFPSGAARFPGDVFITFDVNSPEGHYSVDNSYNESAAEGWLDRGTGRRSVPPFSISLLIRSRIGSRVSWYEAVLRRRWPYVLCTPGRVTMMGAPTYAQNGSTTTVSPTQISGNVFHLPGVSFVRPPPEGEDPPPDSSTHIFVDANLIGNIFGVLPENPATVNVGGTARVFKLLMSGELGDPVQVTSTGNVLNGSVDVASADTTTAWSVYPGNEAIGAFKRDVKPYNLVENLQRAFELPNVGDFQVVPLQANPPGWEPAPPPQPEAEEPDPDGGPVDPGGTPGEGEEPPPEPEPEPSPSASPEPGEEPEDPGPPPYFVLFEDLVLQGPPRDEASESFSYPPEACYRIEQPCGNRYVINGNPHNIYYTGAGIELHDAMLYISGNLDLSSTRPAAGGTVVVPALRGTNATIIVDGTLILNNGSLSASNEGMVIYCRRLVSATQGTYKGLILVQKSAAICPAYPGATIDIEGGIVCGGQPVALYALNPNFNPSVETSPEQVSVYLQGLHLWSTRLTYNPKYLKTLNRFGPLKLLSMRQIE